MNVLQLAESLQPSGLSLRQPCRGKSSPALPPGASGRRRSAQSEPFVEEPAERLRLPWPRLRGDEPSSPRRRAALHREERQQQRSQRAGAASGSARAASIPRGSGFPLGAPQSSAGVWEVGDGGWLAFVCRGRRAAGLSSRSAAPGSCEFNEVRALERGQSGCN